MQHSKKPYNVIQKQALLILLIPVLLLGCGQAAEVDPETTTGSAESRCGADGFLHARFVGGIEAKVDWSGDEISCDSMLRPNGEGVRLRLGGNVADEWLAVIVALPDLVRGEAGKELPSNVTITVEGSGRFFSTPGLDSCWTDIGEQQRLSDDTVRYTIKGTLYCIAPLGELNGNAAVTVGELSFASIVDWSEE